MGGSASANPRRHRFVQDGDVPVTVIRNRPPEDAAPSDAAPGNRLEAAQAALAAERALRERAERAMEEAQATIRDLRTKLAHMELAREEALVQPAPAHPAEAEAPQEAEVPATLRRTRGPGRRQLLALAEGGQEPGSDATPTPKLRKLAAERSPRPEKEAQPVKWWVRPRPTKAPIAKAVQTD